MFRAYQWGEDGLFGICDEGANVCLALALWNGKDPILKERLFGLTATQVIKLIMIKQISGCGARLKKLSGCGSWVKKLLIKDMWMWIQSKEIIDHDDIWMWVKSKEMMWWLSFYLIRVTMEKMSRSSTTTWTLPPPTRTCMVCTSIPRGPSRIRSLSRWMLNEAILSLSMNSLIQVRCTHNLLSYRQGHIKGYFITWIKVNPIELFGG